jgi:protein SCO1
MLFTSHIRRFALALATTVAILAPAVASAGDASTAAPNSAEANEIDVQEHLGEFVDTSLTFTDYAGKEVQLGDFLDGERPILLTLNYYRCPVLCNVQLNALTEALRELEWTPGDAHFQIVTVSLDPREGPTHAEGKRRVHLASLEKGDDVGWTFLTGDAINIKLLAAQLGIGYAYDKEQDQYAHPPVVTFVSPKGKIARYIYGLTYDPRDLKFGLLEAAEGRVGSTMDKLILSCFHYDATLGRYGPFAMGIMRLGGGFMVLIVGAALFFFWRRERHFPAKPAEALS